MAESQYIIELSKENFQQVLEASRQIPVLVDFWASWCQPCQILMPLLAKLADEYQGRFLLAKLNTEQEQELAAQFGIRSIPTVKVFRNGRPIDEFMGALPEAELRKFLDKHLPRESDTLVARARDRLLAGDGDGALALLAAARESDPDNPRVLIALAQAQGAMGDTTAAAATLDSLPPDEQAKPEVATLRSHLYFEGLIAGAPAGNALQARLAADSNDSEARFQLAVHKVVDQEYEAGMELLLELMRKDRKYGEDAARRALVRVFDLLGNDPLVNRYRNRMATLLY